MYIPHYVVDRGALYSISIGGVETSEDEVDHSLGSNKIMPKFVFSLDASNDFLKERVMNLPQEVVEDTHNTEEGRTKYSNSREIGLKCMLSVRG